MDSTNATNRCSRCGVYMSSEARGNCPACLLRGMASVENPHPPFPTPEGYTLICEIGRGGNGVVWKARQHGLEREVALKVLAAGMLAGESEKSRLRREAEAMARLHHPHIVAVHEVGEIEGYLFIAMDYLGAGSLAERLRAGPLEQKAAAALLRDIADAVAHAHACGVIHRDLKPGNILLDSLGSPHLADFGLAKLLPRTNTEGEQPHTPFELTLTGHPLGTVHYLAPEQADGSARNTNTSADIHALGAVLYHCLTGRPPFLGVSFAETLRQVVQELPPSVRSLNPLVSKDLENICLKCLRKQPAHRYATVADLREDLDHFLTRRPVSARPLPAPVRLWNVMKRHPAASLSLGVSIALMATGVVVSNHHALVEKKLRLAAVLAVRKLEFSLLDQMDSKGQRDVTLRTLARLAHENPQDTVIAKRLAWALQEAPLSLPATQPSTIPGTHGASISENHRWLVIASNQGIVTVQDTSTNGTPTLWSRNSTETLHRVIISNDGRFVAASSTHALWLWDRDSTNQVKIPHDEKHQIDFLRFSKNSRILATADTQGNIELRDLPHFTPRNLGWTQPTEIRDLEFSPDSRFLSSGGTTPPFQIWDLRTGKRHFAINGSTSRHGWSSDSRRVLVYNHAVAKVNLLDIESESILLTLGPVQAPTVALFSPDESRIVTATFGGIVQLWDSMTGSPVGKPMEHPQWVKSVEFSPDGSMLSTVCQDGLARIWSTKTCRLHTQPLVHPTPLRMCSFTADGEHVYTHTGGGWGQLWSLPKPRSPWAQLAGKPFPWPLVTDSVPVATSPDDTLLAVASGDGTVEIADLQTHSNPIVRTIEHAVSVHQVAFSADSSLLATVTTNHIVRVWSSRRSELLYTSPVVDQRYSSLKFSPKGHQLAFTAKNGAIDLLEFDKKTLIRAQGGHTATARCLAFSPDGTMLATGGDDRTLRLWNTQDRLSSFKTLQLPENPNNLVFSPSGHALYATCEDHFIRAWSLPSCEPIQPALAMEGPSYSLEVSKDGKHLLNACNDGYARLWNLANGSLEKLFPMDGQMHATLSSDASLVATGNDEGAFQVWDVQSGLSVSGQIYQEKEWVEPYFSKNVSFLIAGSRAIEARQWPIPPIHGPLPPWMIELAEAASGRDINPAGSMVPSNPMKRWNAVEAVRQSKDSSAIANWAKELVTR